MTKYVGVFYGEVLIKPRRHYNLVALGQVCRPKRRELGYSGLKDLQLGIHDQVVVEDLTNQRYLAISVAVKVWSTQGFLEIKIS